MTLPPYMAICNMTLSRVQDLLVFLTAELSNNRLSSIYSRFLGFGQTVVDEQQNWTRIENRDEQQKYARIEYCDKQQKVSTRPRHQILATPRDTTHSFNWVLKHDYSRTSCRPKCVAVTMAPSLVWEFYKKLFCFRSITVAILLTVGFSIIVSS